MPNIFGSSVIFKVFATYINSTAFGGKRPLTARFWCSFSKKSLNWTLFGPLPNCHIYKLYMPHILKITLNGSKLSFSNSFWGTGNPQGKVLINYFSTRLVVSRRNDESYFCNLKIPWLAYNKWWISIRCVGESCKRSQKCFKCGGPNGAQGEFQTASLTLKFGTDQLDHFGFDILEGFWKTRMQSSISKHFQSSNFQYISLRSLG